MTMAEYESDTETGTGIESGRRSRVADARAKAGEKLGHARTRASDAYSSARERTSAAYDTARERAGSAAATAREGAARAGRRTAEGIEASPVGALIGGLALGALIAAVLPKTRREEELIGDYGRRLNNTAREAARAAKDAGRGKLDELGINQQAAKDTLSDFASKAGEAARTSAGAAAKTVKSQPTQSQRTAQPQ